MYLQAYSTHVPELLKKSLKKMCLGGGELVESRTACGKLLFALNIHVMYVFYKTKDVGYIYDVFDACLKMAVLSSSSVGLIHLNTLSG